MSVLVYGGSFNPPHMGHIRSLCAAAEALAPDRILLIPAAVPPHKALAEGSPPAEDRLAMAALAAEELPGAEADGMELLREGKSYTSDTLRLLSERYPGQELVFLLGTDMLVSLPEWHEPETVCALATIAVFARETGREREIAAAAERLRRDYGARVRVIPGEAVTVSSTEIRAALPTRGGADQVPGRVYAYIIRKRLYGAKPDFSWLREQAYSCLKPTRVPHVRGVEEEALRMAERWGADAGDAAEAAICHDITKAVPHEEQLKLCESYFLAVDDLERTNEKLLHAKTGAALAAERFGVSDDVALAIRFHTTGRPGMTTLEMITYLADYIEPNRSGFEGLEELRTACYQDLDRAMELGLRMSLCEVSEKGMPAHKNTVLAHDWYLNNLRRRGLAPCRAAGIPDSI